MEMSAGFIHFFGSLEDFRLRLNINCIESNEKILSALLELKNLLSSSGYKVRVVFKI